MKGRFIYVFSPEDRDKLLELGYILLADSHDNKVFIFANKENMAFSDASIKHVVSDVVSFDLVGK